MQQAPAYQDAVAEIIGYLQQRISACAAAGLGRERLLVDPGFGFGKTLTHNMELLNAIDRFSALECPVLVGLSRKRMLGMLTGKPEKERMAAGLGTAVVAVMKGARIVRTHDVPETVDALQVCRQLLMIEQ
jgi:dihydropteroate synthase